ncbi:MAG: hypothetical protein AVDCRST_MAG14-2531, partial [uncultured Rubrobacteraceae bacterium]
EWVVRSGNVADLCAGGGHDARGNRGRGPGRASAGVRGGVFAGARWRPRRGRRPTYRGQPKAPRV